MSVQFEIHSFPWPLFKQCYEEKVLRQDNSPINAKLFEALDDDNYDQLPLWGDFCGYDEVQYLFEFIERLDVSGKDELLTILKTFYDYSSGSIISDLPKDLREQFSECEGVIGPDRVKHLATLAQSIDLSIIIKEAEKLSADLVNKHIKELQASEPECGEVEFWEEHYDASEFGWLYDAEIHEGLWDHFCKLIEVVSSQQNKDVCFAVVVF